MLQKLLLPAALLWFFISQKTKAAFDQFSYKINGFKVSAKGGQLGLIPNFSIYNPTGANVKINSGGLALAVNGNTIAQFTGPINTTLTGNSWNIVELNFTAKGLGAANVIYQLANGAKFKTTSIKGSLKTSTGTVPVNYIFTYE